MAWESPEGGGGAAGGAGGRPELRPDAVLVAATALGLSAVLTQLLVVRELMGVFSGNELAFGLALASWLALGALGAALGRRAEGARDRPRLVIALLSSLGALPLLQVLAVRLLRNAVLRQGEMAGPLSVLSSALAVLAPYCLASGALFTLACALLSRRGRKGGVGDAYLMDALGGVLGGAAFSFALVHVLQPVQTALVALAVDLSAAAVVARVSGRRALAGALALAMVAAVFAVASLDLELATARVMLSSPRAVAAALPTLGEALAFARDPSAPRAGLAEVVAARDSPYGRLAVTREGGQLTFWESGAPLFSTGDLESREETVHYALLQHPAPRSVLLISGGAGGSALEALKHGVERVDYVELDPLVVELGRRLTSNLDDPRIRVHAVDGRRFLRSTRERYDAVIVDLPEPVTTQLNRFYTREFVGEVRSVLRPGGVLSLSSSGLSSYASVERRRLNSAIYRTLAAQFANVTVVPGWRTFFVASDGPLSRDIPRLVEERGIETTYVRREYVAAELSPERLAIADSSVSEPGPENTDLHPVTSYLALGLWMGYFGGAGSLALPLGALAAAAALAALAMRPVPRAVLAVGLAGSALEVVLVAGFQAVHGYVYSSVGLLVAAFMGGLSLGAARANRLSATRRLLAAAMGALAALSLLAASALSAMAGSAGGSLADSLAPIAFPLLSLLAGSLVGACFPLAAALLGGDAARTASALYAADLAGACAGALAVSTVLLPLLGIPLVCALVATLLLAAAVAVLREG